MWPRREDQKGGDLTQSGEESDAGTGLRHGPPPQVVGEFSDRVEGECQEVELAGKSVMKLLR